MSGGRPAGAAVAEVLSILRFHIVLIAVAAALVFGWLTTGAYPVVVALIGGVDWLLINLFNRVTDVEEDRLNAVRGAERVGRWRRVLAALTFAALGASFVVTHLLLPGLTPWRALVQAIGLGYSYRIVPWPGGLRRFKDIYFLKNFLSAGLFCLTGLVYPLAAAGWGVALAGGPWAVALLGLYFVPFELTYEILYDLRDLEGDRAVGVPTYPVVHGPETARRIIDGLLGLSAVPLVAGLATGLLGVREGLMLAAPAVQLAYYRPRFARGLTASDCIRATHLGTALLVLYLVGTRVWLGLGLPDNVFLVG